jgi:hypothetical protein
VATRPVVRGVDTGATRLLGYRGYPGGGSCGNLARPRGSDLADIQAED